MNYHQFRPPPNVTWYERIFLCAAVAVGMLILYWILKQCL